MTQQQQQQTTTAPPPKNKKNKKRQKKAAQASEKTPPSSATSTSNPTQSTAGTPAKHESASPRKPRQRKPRQRTPFKKSMQSRAAQEMYGEELPMPPAHKASTKGKEKAAEPNNANLKGGEVDPLGGLFFVDTTPAKLPKDLKKVEKPVLGRMKSATPPPALSKSPSPSPAPQALVEDKIVPDYVGTSNEITEADVVKDNGIHPVEGSSKDLLDAIIKYSTPTEKPEAQQAEEQPIDVQEAGTSDREAVHALQGPTIPAQDATESAKPPSVDMSTPVTQQSSDIASPSGTKRKRDEEPLIDAESRKRSTLLGDLLSEEDSSSSEEEQQDKSKEQNHVASESDGDSSAQGDAGPDDLALNMEIDVVGAGTGTAEPPLAMEVDLTGSAVPEEHSVPIVSAEQASESPKDVFVTALNSRQEGSLVRDMDEDIVAPEGVEDDEYQADRSRYFKEDDPLKLCARCGETGHTVRDCAHVQCLTCGKLDDHGTRSCPLTMTCFRCNSRGHHIKDCPLTPEQARNGVNQFCERCSSHTHKSSTCPYIWRVYIRAADAPAKSPKIHFACYNCASADHFGDDCKFPRGHPIPNSERTAFTMDPDNNRKSHIRFDSALANASSMPRPNIVNGTIQPRKEVSPPPSHAPKGPRGPAAAKGPNRRERSPPPSHAPKDARGPAGAKRPNRKEQRRMEMARPSLEEELRKIEEDRRRHGEFGDLGDLEAGQIDEDEDAFVKRLDKNKNAPQQPKGPRPGARDRRRAREGDSKTDTDSSVTGDAGPKKSFQPFKHFTEPPGVNGNSLNRPRSLSRSPPPARRREGRQPSPIAMDSPAQARSAEQWKRGRDLQDRGRSGRQSPRGGDGRGGFASGSLLDRIDRGTNASSGSNSRGPASRDPRNYDSQERKETRHWEAQASGPEPRKRPNGYTPDPEINNSSNSNSSSRRGGNPHYKGGYF